MTRWSDDEIEILKKNFRNGEGADTCHRLLKQKRSNSAIHGKAYTLGLVGCRMSKTNIILKMHEKSAGSLFTTRSIGGNIDLLTTMRNDGLISSKDGGWFLSRSQHAALSFLFD